MRSQIRKRSTGWIGAGLVLTGLVLPAGVLAGSGNDATETFLSLKCNLCHPVEVASIPRRSTSDKMKGPDLSTTGNRRTAEWIERYLLREETIEGKEHKKEFKGTKKEASGLANWLSQLKASVASR